MNEHHRTICPERLAEKLACVKNFENQVFLREITEEPRLIEALCYLARVSRAKNYPDGLQRFTLDLIADSGDLLGTELMHGEYAGDCFPDEVWQQIAADLPDYFVRETIDRDTYSFEEELGNSHRRKKRARVCRGRLLGALEKCAGERLIYYFEWLCERVDVTFARQKGERDEGRQAPWFFPRIATALLRFMDRRAEHLSQSIAETEWTREIFVWLRRCARLRGPTHFLEGPARFGKSESVKAFRSMFLGKVLFIETPPGNGETELLIEVAEELGLDLTSRRRPGELRTRIKFVLQQLGLMPIFDEGPMLYPATVTRSTTPARLNWLRRGVLDAGSKAVWDFGTHARAKYRAITQIHSAKPET